MTDHIPDTTKIEDLKKQIERNTIGETK